MKPFALVVLALALLASGCATVPLAPETPDRLVTQRQAPETATLVIYRPPILGSMFLHTVTLDGVLVGSLATRTYLEIPVTPGTHILGVGAEAQLHRRTLHLDAGETIYVKSGAKPGSIVLSQMDPKEGARALRRSRLAQRLDQ
jgi:hypothetical protein